MPSSPSRHLESFLEFSYSWNSPRKPSDVSEQQLKIVVRYEQGCGRYVDKFFHKNSHTGRAKLAELHSQVRNRRPGVIEVAHQVVEPEEINSLYGSKHAQRRRTHS